MKLKKISIQNSPIFLSREEAIKSCFGNSISIPQQIAQVNTKDGCDAWLCKSEYVANDGAIRSGSNSANWKNHFEKEGKIIISWLYEDEPAHVSGTQPELSKVANPLHCFWCENPKAISYQYMGTFLEDLNATRTRKRIYRLIREEIDLSPWQD